MTDADLNIICCGLMPAAQNSGRGTLATENSIKKSNFSKIENFENLIWNIQFWKHPIYKTTNLKKIKTWKKLAISAPLPGRWKLTVFSNFEKARKGPTFSHFWKTHFEKIQIQKIKNLQNEHFQNLHFQNDDF